MLQKCCIQYLTHLIKRFHDEKREISFPRSALSGINMPSATMIQHHRRKYKMHGSFNAEIVPLEDYVSPVRLAYIDLFNRTDQWYRDYHDKDLEFCLDVIKSFDRDDRCVFPPLIVSMACQVEIGSLSCLRRLMPFPKKSRQTNLSYSSSTKCFSEYIDADTAIMSMLFNPQLQVPGE